MTIRSEEVAKRYFESLGFRIRDRDFDGRKKVADFFIELDDCIQSVEAKTRMGEWLQFLKPQIDRIRDGGLVAVVRNEEVSIRTMEDIEELIEVRSYRVIWKE
ncbi:MAG: hypothetical protein ACFE7R_10165 [Candidatus Hodarchaeota archaeon]